ncbi:GGDEF domain-containing protein [Rhodoferax sp. 4810]|nr:GGDEF domain-containing protein [Rhodoferax jenense]
MTFTAQRDDNITLQLLRYEALFKLIDSISALDDIQAIARQVTTQWKYFANVAGWHMVVPSSNGFMLIDGIKSDAQVACADSLSTWDDHYWRLRLPRLMDARQPDALQHLPQVLSGPAVCEVLVIPFERAEQTIGLLSVAARNEPFNELDKKFIRIFGRHLADRIDMLLIRHQATRALTEQATHDALTQLLNRGTIIQELANKLALAKRTGLPLGVIMLDLDFFKRINDQYGHPAGDEVLCEASNRLLAQTRDGDSLGRYGGEEFLVVLYPCTEEEVALAAERFRQTIEEQPVMLAGCSANTLDLTISLGTTCSAGQDAVRVEKLLKQADEALYRSKALGRNRVTRYTAP